MATKQKPTYEALDDELDAPPPKMNLKALDAGADLDDEQAAANSKKLGGKWGASTSLPPSPADDAPAHLRFNVPSYVKRQLALRAAEQNVTEAYLVLKALAASGIEIRPTDLVPDKRKVRGK